MRRGPQSHVCINDKKLDNIFIWWYFTFTLLYFQLNCSRELPLHACAGRANPNKLRPVLSFARLHGALPPAPSFPRSRPSRRALEMPLRGILLLLGGGVLLLGLRLTELRVHLVQGGRRGEGEGGSGGSCSGPGGGGTWAGSGAVA